jgi:hypothetical protein
MLHGSHEVPPATLLVGRFSLVARWTESLPWCCGSLNTGCFSVLGQGLGPCRVARVSERGVSTVLRDRRAGHCPSPRRARKFASDHSKVTHPYGSKKIPRRAVRVTINPYNYVHTTTCRSRWQPSWWSLPFLPVPTYVAFDGVQTSSMPRPGAS